MLGAMSRPVDPARLEALLSRLMRDARLAPYGFRRGARVGAQSAGFVSHAARLIVACGPGRVDAERDAWLRRLGYRELRFEGESLVERPSRVLDDILTAARLACRAKSIVEASARAA